MNQIKKIWRHIDPFSLRVRLTIGVAAVSALGLGSFAIWTSWKMQQILIDSHKHSIEEIATRLPHDVQLYSEMLPPETGLQKAINNLTTTNTLLWVKNPESKMLVKSTIGNLLSDSTAAELMSLTEMPAKPQVHKVSQRYFVLYCNSLRVQGKVLGNLFVVQDITYEQTMFQAMLWSLSIASVLAIMMISVAIAFYIKRSLQPLRQLSQMTEVISAEDLPEAHLYLDNAPSEVKELTQTFNMMLSRLSQSWEQERQFVSNVSHELRTPLTIVHGYLQSVLRRQNNLTEIQREALETAASEAERTIRLLQDLLDLARADSGYLHFRIEPCVLNELVAEVVTMAKKYSDRTIIIESKNDSIEVKVDYNRLKQILLNLIDNAVKYSQPDTTVIVKLYQQEESAIIQVRDKGYGIPLQHQSRIFERFYRVDEARTSSTGGCGLGLSIVKTLVEGMDGSVTVRSRLSEGSVFTITLPAYRLPD
ncbi:two-component sensor histidine kinase [Tolypothrix sp. NIES-4075]|uniref:sensor histidine kinase n=1 Tax=Tolypothrix sp. NIES-4075 TaxID=2005459 RepID=UPI000B5C8110|nr:ATP-binding protein [Tolypothrix sp. NIES-4075]GAX42755.1 two-component sensor histidine kinase [Tolypothrix sp. NIES-4075]